MPYIKRGFGFTVGYDFARAVEDTPIELDAGGSHPRVVYGWIAGNPDSKLGFMRAPRIRVAVDRRDLGGVEVQED